MPAVTTRPPRLPAVDRARCTGCGRCVAICPPHVLSLETVHWVKTAVLHEPARCTGCSDCAVVCPFRAITMRRPHRPDPV
jgi:ferredoxin